MLWNTDGTRYIPSFKLLVQSHISLLNGASLAPDLLCSPSHSLTHSLTRLSASTWACLQWFASLQQSMLQYHCVGFITMRPWASQRRKSKQCFQKRFKKIHRCAVWVDQCSADVRVDFYVANRCASSCDVANRGRTSSPLGRSWSLSTDNGLINCRECILWKMLKTSWNQKLKPNSSTLKVFCSTFTPNCPALIQNDQSY